MIRLSNFQFKLIINGLAQSIDRINNEFDKSMIKPECCCTKKELESGKLCWNCEGQKLKHELRDIHSKLQNYQKNTVWTKTYVSLIAFEEACEKLDIPITIDNVHNKSGDQIIKKMVYITIKHFALDPQGGVKGNEYVTFRTRAIRRSESGLNDGIAYFVDNWVINPDRFVIDKKNLFESEEPTIDMHQEDCEYKHLNDFSNCDCLANVELYTSSDEFDNDFWWEELDHNLEQIINQLPIAEFNPSDENQDRVWSIGDRECYNMDEMNRDENYINELNFINGFEKTNR